MRELNSAEGEDNCRGVSSPAGRGGLLAALGQGGQTRDGEGAASRSSAPALHGGTAHHQLIVNKTIDQKKRAPLNDFRVAAARGRVAGSQGAVIAVLSHRCEMSLEP